jgi:predicted sulfurtransferase
MTLKIEAERWCDCVIAPGPVRDQPLRCGEVALSLCDGCGTALCESHEILCSHCLGVTCLNCDHACHHDAENLEIEAA